MKEKRKTKVNKSDAFLIALVVIIFCAIIGFKIYRVAVRASGDLPMPFGIGSAVVQSGSMEPTYKKGDLLFVRRASDFAVGDVVVYKSGNMLVVHRIVSIEGDSITTKGDANNAADSPITAGDIKGKVIGKVPVVGTIIEAMRSPGVIICVIALSVIMLVFSFGTSGRDEDMQELPDQSGASEQQNSGSEGNEDTKNDVDDASDKKK